MCGEPNVNLKAIQSTLCHQPNSDKNQTLYEISAMGNNITMHRYSQARFLWDGLGS